MTMVSIILWIKMSVAENARGALAPHLTWQIYPVPRAQLPAGGTQFQESFQISLLPGSNLQPFESYDSLKLGPPKCFDATPASLHTTPENSVTPLLSDW
jgi:hypothetical protein